MPISVQRPTSEVHTTDLGDAVGQGGLESLAELYKSVRLVECREVAVLGKPRVDGRGEESGGKDRIPHRGFWELSMSMPLK